MAGRPFSYDAGRICLDLLATLGNRHEERLPDPAALERWMAAGGLVDEPCRAGVEDLERARALRGSVRDVVDALLGGERPRSRSIDRINAAAAVPAPAPRLSLGAGGLRQERSPARAAEVLGSIARDAIELLAGPERSMLRECAAPDCSGIYLDASQGRNRRWCSAARCGNRARVAAHRARRHGSATDTGPA